ncbi:hypothetical protein K449DRAFT_381326 [Hypoxylon sp. EC38]|nr:hypothetical protein K449DRAFT_381326 [Hypoxylon sp. EC38]
MNSYTSFLPPSRLPPPIVCFSLFFTLLQKHLPPRLVCQNLTSHTTNYKQPPVHTLPSQPTFDKQHHNNNPTFRWTSRSPIDLSPVDYLKPASSLPPEICHSPSTVFSLLSLQITLFTGYGRQHTHHCILDRVLQLAHTPFSIFS